MAFLLLFILFSLTSASTVHKPNHDHQITGFANSPVATPKTQPRLAQIPVNSQTSYVKTKPSGLTELPVDSWNFYAERKDTTKLSGLTALPVDSWNFYAESKDTTKSSGHTALPVDSWSFYVEPKDTTKSSGLTELPVDSWNFYVEPKDTTKPSGLTELPVDSQTFYVKTKDMTKSSAGLTPIPVNSQTFNVATKSMPKPSDLTAIPVDSRTFDVDDAKDMTKPSSLTAIPVNSHNFYVHKPSGLTAIPVDSRTFDVDAEHMTEPSGLTAIPVDSRTFDVNAKDTTEPSDLTAIPVDSRTFDVNAKDTTEPSGHSAVLVDSRSFDVNSEHTMKHPDNLSYCSVYFKKEELKKGTIICPLFTPQKSLKENSKEMSTILSSICHSKAGNEEGEFKFCTSLYQDMADKVTAKLGKNKVVSSDKVQMNSSTITRFEKISAYGKAVVCHRTEPPPQVSFYCHQIKNSSVYALSLTAADHNPKTHRIAKKLAVCHDNTAAWIPNRLALQLLKMKPGAGVCHLLPSYDLAWIALA